MQQREELSRTIRVWTGLRNPSSCIIDDTILIIFRDFAANLGISFRTPEEYFLDEEPRPFSRAFEPATYIKDQADKPPPGELSLEANTTFKLPAKPVIVLFCGSPGAGKSSFYWRNLKPIGYARVNQDILKTVSAVPPENAMPEHCVTPSCIE